MLSPFKFSSGLSPVFLAPHVNSFEEDVSLCNQSFSFCSK